MRARPQAQRGAQRFSDSVADTTVPHALLLSEPDPFDAGAGPGAAPTLAGPTAPGVLGGSWMGVDDNDAELSQGAYIDGSQVREIDASGWSFQALGLSRFAAQEARRWPVNFVATGAEYLRIWGFNLLMLVLTAGLYYPWARASRLQYLYAHTLMADHPLGFTGRPQRVGGGMLALLLLAALLLWATSLTPWGGVAAALAVPAVGPAVYFARTRFLLTHTTWQRLRFGFGGSLPGAYKALTLPLLLATLPLGLLLVMNDLPGLPAPAPDSALLANADVVYEVHTYDLLQAAVVLMWSSLIAAGPLFWWMAGRYRYGNLRLGPLQTEWRVTLGQSYRVAGPVLLAALAWGALCLKGVLWTIDNGPVAQAAGALAQAPGLAYALGCVAWVVVIAMLGAVLRAYAHVRLQNLAWSHTGNRYLRFRSSLELGPYLILQLRNRVLLLLTLGLYAPWAAVSARQMRARAVTVVSRIVPDEFVNVLGGRPSQQADDAADELLGLRIGW